MNRWQHNLRNSLVALAIVALTLSCGCVAQQGEIEQSLARIDRLEASLARIDTLETRVGTIETEIEQRQDQHGIINIATQGNGLGLGMCVAIVGLCWLVWKLWRARRYWKTASAETIEAIEDDKTLTQGVRQRLAKFHAAQTPFGRLVNVATGGGRCSSSRSKWPKDRSSIAPA